MNALAITNHGHMNSFAHAYLHVQSLNAKGANFKFIPGCEMYVHPDLQTWQLQFDLAKATKKEDKVEVMRLKALLANIDAPLSASLEEETIDVSEEDVGLTVENEEETKSGKFYDPIKRRHHLVVLPTTSTGLQRLFHLVSRGYKEGFYRFPRVDYRMLKEAAEGGHIIVSSACLTGDTSVVTDNGVETLLDVVNRYQSGEHVKILSYNEETGDQEFKSVTWGEMTRKNAKLMKITTEDGKSITCTPDHKVFTDEGWVEAQELLEKRHLRLLSV
jgi:DNA polymerase III alpha subunit